MKKQCLIMTLKTKNYGGILQAVALQKAILGLGYDCETLNLQINKRKKRADKSFVSWIYQNIFIRILGDKKRAKRTAVFLKQNLKQTPLFKENNISNYFISHKHDCVVIGSDQVWNDKMFNTSDAFFFPFIKECVLISYAASFGYSLNATSPKKEHLELLRHFDAISVRESDANDFLINNGIKSTISLDPTFLVPKAEWTNLASSSEICKPNERYGFVYLMPGDDKMVSFIKKAASFYARKYNTTFYIIGLKDSDRIKHDKNNLFGVGPAEWLYLLANSDWVLTNSFHGTVFSLIFNKKFGAVISQKSSINYPGRIINLLDCVNSNSNLIDIDDFKDYPDLLNNNSFESLFAKKINDSKKWLADSLSSYGDFNYEKN